MRLQLRKILMENLMESHEILMNSPMMVHGGPGWLENSHEILMKIPYNLMELLLNAGVSAGAITGLLRLAGPDLKLIKLELVGSDASRSGKDANESVKPKEMKNDRERPEEVDVDSGGSGKAAGEGARHEEVKEGGQAPLTKEQVIEQVLAEADMRGAEKAAQVDRDYQMKLRAKAMQSTKPVEAREILDMTFHHNLEQALGRYVAHLLSSHGLVKLDKQMVLDNDWRKAFITYAEVMDRLIQLHEDAKLLDRIKRERDLYEAYLSYIIEVFEKKTGPTLMRYYQAYTMLTERLPQVLCSSCKRKLTDMLVAESIVGVGA